jgi:hypothetical protein
LYFNIYRDLVFLNQIKKLTYKKSVHRETDYKVEIIAAIKGKMNHKIQTQIQIQQTIFFLKENITIRDQTSKNIKL